MIRTKLYEYQRAGSNRIKELNGRALLADEMGLGKSIQSIVYAVETQSFPLVVICPASLKWNWKNEFLLHAGMRSEVLESRTVPRNANRLLYNKILIINYDILPSWFELLEAFKPKLLIIDECHMLGSNSTIRTRTVRKLAKTIDHVIAISGTPITNRPVEIWPTLNILRPKEFAHFRPFGMRFCKPRRAPWGWDFRGASNLDELNRLLLDLVMIRRRKQDVLKDLPAKSRHVVPIPLSNYKEYETASKDFIRWLSVRTPALAQSASRAEGLVKIGYMKRLAARLKMNGVYDWIDQFLEQTDQKLIVFAVHRKCIESMEKRYKRRCVVVNGSVRGDKRRQAFEKFNTQANCRLFIGNIKAAGVGWNGTAASTVVFAETGWTCGEHTQAEDRVHRIGQTKKSSAYYLVAQGTIEELIFKIIQKKASVISDAIDGGEANDLEIYDLLLQELKK